MTASAGVLAGPDRARISSRPGVAPAGLAPPPGERAPLAEGAAPWVSPTPTRGRVIVPLSNGVAVVTETVPRREMWRVDNINNAPDAETALRLMFAWVRAEAARCERTRPEDADGFRWQVIHLLAPFAAAMHRSRPVPQFRSGPKLPGGGWMPRKPKTRAAEARRP